MQQLLTGHHFLQLCHWYLREKYSICNTPSGTHVRLTIILSVNDWFSVAVLLSLGQREGGGVDREDQRGSREDGG